MSIATVFVRSAIATFASVCCAAAGAQDIEATDGEPFLETRAVESVWRPRLSAGFESAAPQEQRLTDREAWALVTSPAGEGLGRRNILFTVRVPFGQRSDLVVDHVVARARSAGIDPNRSQPDRPLGIGLEFRAANAAQLAGLRQGTLLKVNLNSSSSVGLRARKGRLVVMWRAQW